MKLTKRSIDAIAPPPSGKKFYFDDTIHGFGVAVWASGTKSFIYQDRIKGRKRRMTIGRCGQITLKDARKEAQKLAGQITSGHDPIEERHKQKKESLTLYEAMQGYLENRGLKETTQKDIARAMKNFSDWMSRPIVNINRDMVAKRHKKLGQKSHARANLAMRYLRAIINFASEANAYPDGRPLITDNPVNALSATRTWYKVSRRKRYLQEHEIQPWMQAVFRLPEIPHRESGQGRKKPKLRHGDLAKDFFLILLLTGLRRSEVLDLTWDNVDLTGKTLTIPDPKNHETHTLPMSDYLYDLFLSRKGKSGGHHVLSGPDGKRYQGFRYAQARIEEETGIKVSPHDLRRTFATIAESLNIPAYAVKGLLNHKTNGDITAGYIQITVERLRKPMQQVSDYILKKGGIKEGKLLNIKKATN